MSEPMARAGAGVSVTGIGKRFEMRRPLVETLRAPFRRQWLTVLDDVSLEVPAGEFFGLLGPNGAGKTTLFKILSTVVLPDRGDALIGGESVVRAPERTRTMLSPVIADERSLFWRVSSLENLRLFGSLQGLSAAAATARARELLLLVGLDETGTRMVGTFSSGMRQRLLIARALLARPRVLLLDEPTRSLDPVSARDLRRFLREELCDRLGCTILLATHSAEEAIELCDRVGVLHRGRLLALGPREQLARQVADDRHRLVASPDAGAVLRTLAWRGLVGDLRDGPGDEQGWQTFTFTAPGGRAAIAEVVQELAAAGARLAEVQAVQPTLADLIERIVRTRGTEVAHA